MELSIDRYLCQERFAAEKRALFQGLPVVVGFSSQLARPGDFLTHAHSGVPLLVLRDEDGQLRAFVNVCRHRGSVLMEDPSGTLEGHIVCPYHGWSYDRRGCLRGVPHRDGIPGLEPSKRSLRALHVCERFGLIFVVPDPGAPEPRATFLNGLLEDLDDYGLAGYAMRLPSTRVLAMNWKLMMDASYECYHFRTVHGSTVGPWFFDNIGAFDWDDPHLRMVFPKRSLLELRGRPPQEWSLRKHVNSIYGIFPNTVVMILEDHAVVSTAWPVDVDRTLIASALLTPRDPGRHASWRDLVAPGARARPSSDEPWKLRERVYWSAIEEDVAMAERIQRGLRSGANSRFVLARFEEMIARSHDAIDRTLAGQLGARLSSTGLPAQGAARVGEGGA